MRVFLILVALLAPASFADESRIQLKDGPGKDLVAGRCTVCHSLDYIQMNSFFLDRQGWEGEVKKMIKAFGAPIQPNELSRVVDYLAQNYGKRPVRPVSTPK